MASEEEKKIMYKRKQSVFVIPDKMVRVSHNSVLLKAFTRESWPLIYLIRDLARLTLTTYCSERLHSHIEQVFIYWMNTCTDFSSCGIFYWLVKINWSTFIITCAYIRVQLPVCFRFLSCSNGGLSLKLSNMAS